MVFGEAGEGPLVKVLFDMVCVDGEINSNGRQFASASANRTPEFTPSGSPKRTPMTLPPRGRSAAVSPTLQAVKGPLKWHSSSDGRLSLPSSMPTSKHSTAPNSPPKSGPNSGHFIYIIYIYVSNQIVLGRFLACSQLPISSCT